MGSRIEPQDEPLSPWLKTLGSNSSQFKDTEDTDLGIRRGSECFLQDQPLPPRVAPWVAPWNLKTSIFTDEEDMDQEIEIEIEDPNPWREPTTVFSAPMLCPSRISKLNDFTPTPYTLSVLTPMLDGKIAYPVDPPGKSIQDSTIAHEPNATTVGSLKTSVCSSFGTESESVTFEPQEWPEELRKHLRKDSAEKTRKESCEDLLKKRPEYRGQHKKRVELPLNILGSTYSTLPDTGSNENIMAKEIALKLHTNIDDTAEYQKEFQVADGNVVKSLGRISISCAFTEEPDVEHFCTFYVFTTLVVPVIMGAAFLHATETLTKHKNRLRTTMAPCNGLSQICTLNNPIQSIRCWANGEAVLASADTGSDLNVVSLAYTKLRGFRVKKPSDTSNLQVQFADGSKAWTVGETTIKMKFAGKSRSLRPAERYTLENPTIKRKFYVLKGLTSDILLGREFLEETDTFETYKSLFTSNTNRRALSQVNTIVWLKTAETYLSRLSSRVSLAVPEPMPVEYSGDVVSRYPMEKWKKRYKVWLNKRRRCKFKDKRSGSSRGLDLMTDFETQMDNRDARELHRREVVKKSIERLPPQLTEQAWMKEMQDVDAYEALKSSILSSSREQALPGRGDLAVTSGQNPLLNLE